MVKLLIILISTLAVTSCVTPPDFSEEPQLSYVGMSKSNLLQAELGTDTLLLYLRFTDGDGDVGVPDGENQQNVTIIDSRTGEPYAKFSTPIIPAEGANNGIDVDLTLLLLNECCFYEPTEIDTIPACSIVESFPTNEIVFSITIKDQAGNVSNAVESDPLTLICFQ